MKINRSRKFRISEETKVEEPITITISDKEEKTSDGDYTKDIINFGSKLLMFGVEAHLWHLNCESNAVHLTLKDLYEGCDDLGDKLLEAALGISGGYIENKKDNEEYKFGDLRYGEDCIDKIRSMEIEAEDLIESCEDSGIENILADFCELCNSTVYKLRRLK